MNDLFFKDLRLILSDRKQGEAYRSMVNTLVVAGPGSGKTRVLTLKAVSLAKSNITKPAGLACISYSRESVRELKRRLREYGYTPSNRDFVGTVHSFSLLQVIQPFAHLFPQYGVKRPIKILSSDNANHLYHSVLSEMRIADPKMLPFTEINRHRSLSISGRSNVSISSTDLVANAAIKYEAKLHSTEFLDFISIINVSAKIIREQPFVRKVLQSRFPWLLVDEYQDLGKPLHEMVTELVFNAGMKLYAVGDENQSIYGFNGGYPDFLRELAGYDDITPIYLSSNYRSTQHIIDGSLETLQATPHSPVYVAEKRKNEPADFTFITCDEEMEEQFEVVAKKIIPKLVTQGVPYNEIGIIVSSNSEISGMANFLQNESISFFIAKWSFDNSAVVVWLQDCALWCCDRGKQSFDEVFRFWKRLLNEHEDKRRFYDDIRLKIMLNELLVASSTFSDLTQWLKFIVNGLLLREMLLNSNIYPDEIRNIDKLISEAEFYNLKGSKIRRFANLGKPDNEVTITTRHSSKGLEFEVVVMLGMEEERFPSYRNLQNPTALLEEQRLCYVCISRAKRSCILIRSKIYTIPTRRGDWRKTFTPSRFWVSLQRKFGTGANQFTNKSFI